MMKQQKQEQGFEVVVKEEKKVDDQETELKVGMRLPGEEVLMISSSNIGEVYQKICKLEEQIMKMDTQTSIDLSIDKELYQVVSNGEKVERLDLGDKLLYEMIFS